MCQSEYQYFVPKDSHDRIDANVERVCSVFGYGGWASGTYVHES